MFFKKLFQKRAISKLVIERHIKYMSLYDIKSVIVVFNLDDDNILDTIKRLIQILDNRSIKFKILGFNFFKKEYPTLSLDHRIQIVEKKDLNFYGIPIKSDIINYLRDDYNLYIDFNINPLFTFKFISYTINANFKIGRTFYENYPYDLYLDNIKEGSSRNYLNTIIHYLSSIKSA